MQLRVSRRRKETTIVVSRQAQRLAELWREDGGVDDDDDLSRFFPVDSLVSRPVPGSLTFIQGSLAGGFILEGL